MGDERNGRVTMALVGQKLDALQETVDMLNARIMDPETGIYPQHGKLKGRVGNLERSHQNAVWALRAIVLGVLGVIGTLLAGGI